MPTRWLLERRTYDFLGREDGAIYIRPDMPLDALRLSEFKPVAAGTREACEAAMRLLEGA